MKGKSENVWSKLRGKQATHQRRWGEGMGEGGERRGKKAANNSEGSCMMGKGVRKMKMQKKCLPGGGAEDKKFRKWTWLNPETIP